MGLLKLHSKSLVGAGWKTSTKTQLEQMPPQGKCQPQLPVSPSPSDKISCDKVSIVLLTPPPPKKNSPPPPSTITSRWGENVFEKKMFRCKNVLFLCAFPSGPKTKAQTFSKNAVINEISHAHILACFTSSHACGKKCVWTPIRSSRLEFCFWENDSEEAQWTWFTANNPLLRHAVPPLYLPGPWVTPDPKTAT